MHLSDIHLDKGMHCVDCHFEQDCHGNGQLYGEAARGGGDRLRGLPRLGPRTRLRCKTSEHGGAGGGGTTWRCCAPRSARGDSSGSDGQLMQRSMVEPDEEWAVSQVLDSVTPGIVTITTTRRAGRRRCSATARLAGDPSGPLAHSDERMSCYTCHTSWMTSCFGCHLSMKANANRPSLHWEGDVNTRNFTTYNFQVLRDDVFMLGLDSTAKKNKIVPVRSSSAVLVRSQNANREWIYHQQQTISSGRVQRAGVQPALSAHGAHARDPHVHGLPRYRATTTTTPGWRNCCCRARTSSTSWGATCTWARAGTASKRVAVTEHDEPQAVIGSYLQKLAYPEDTLSPRHG